MITRWRIEQSGRPAKLVKLNTRSSDLVGRYGGDEFMVLITSTTADQVISYAEKLREKIASTAISIPGSESPVRITISGGLAMFPDHGQSTTELFKAADEALYESKRHGRNRIMVATSVGLGGKTGEGADADQGFRKQEPDDAEAGVLDYAFEDSEHGVDFGGVFLKVDVVTGDAGP